MTQPQGPIDISGEEFIDPPPEIEAAFAESFAGARIRIAREEAERRIAEEEE
tara:strand:+ start:6934 stop:7089 length:156 start_codon:yes stop_codon:yes gene_type:complete